MLLLITLAFAAAGVMRLMRLQLVDGSSYFEQSLSSTTSEQIIVPPRGQIMDNDGTFLVSNKLGFNCVIEKAFFPLDDENANRVVLAAAQILEEDGHRWEDALPMSIATPFELIGSDSEIERLRKTTGVQSYATANEIMIALQRMYDIPADLPVDDRRIIAGIRYTMTIRDFSVANRFTLATDISMQTVVKLKERAAELDGVDVSEEAIRVNEVGDVVPHLIGTVGAISAEEYEELRDSGYMLSDTLGKSGVEKAMEDELKGSKGLRTFEIMSGKVVSDTTTVEAVPGNSIKLTVDSGYQRRVQTILENHIHWLNNQSSSQAKGTGADAGAIVVLDVKTGALLAAATYPTYDLIDYIDDYSSVASRSNSPLTNRATSGRYRPGSTFKTVTATAALNEGIIGPSHTVDCRGFYDYWEDWKPYPECTGYHGRLNVVSALRESCNIFFYDVGRITGIDTIAEYASLYGLGEEMGLEMGRGIKTGYVATPESFAENGMVWQVGNVIQAAIGQSDTYVTPLQMAGQAMMIANKGTRYQTYMVDSVYDYGCNELIRTTEPVIAAQIPDKTGYTFYSVTEGMKEAAAYEQYQGYPRNHDYYTGNYLLTTLPKRAAIKTGTPQMRSKYDTSSAFIGFYPADDPEIAFSGFVEHGEYSKFMIKDIIQAYYDEEEYDALPKVEDPTAVLSDTQPVTGEDGGPVEPEVTTMTEVFTGYSYTEEQTEPETYYEEWYEEPSEEPSAPETADTTDDRSPYLEPPSFAEPEFDVETEYIPEPVPEETSPPDDGFYDPGLYWFTRDEEE
ncbi:MAG: hypothetical protein IKR73_00520 [Oscillospiraceae bacterium]|nr:hypothetical protein [Oscillospiraceae bacterium]